MRVIDDSFVDVQPKKKKKKKLHIHTYIHTICTKCTMDLGYAQNQIFCN
jgi:hypothetical protein